jgi:hypothetical protein
MGGTCRINARDGNCSKMAVCNSGDGRGEHLKETDPEGFNRRQLARDVLHWGEGADQGNHYQLLRKHLLLYREGSWRTLVHSVM